MGAKFIHMKNTLITISAAVFALLAFVAMPGSAHAGPGDDYYGWYSDFVTTPVSAPAPSYSAPVSYSQPVSNVRPQTVTYQEPVRSSSCVGC